MEFEAEIRRITEILSGLRAEPSADERALLNDLLTEVHDAGYQDGKRRDHA